MSELRVICATIGVLLFTACGGEGPDEPPVPGAFQIRVSSNSPVGAIVFEIARHGVSQVSVNCPTPRCDWELNGEVYRVIAAGQVSGHVATIVVANREEAPMVTLIEAARPASPDPQLNYQLFAVGQVSLSAVLQ